MPILKQWRRRLRALVQRAEVERELDEELAFHIAMETEAYVRAGLDPVEARRRARLAFGAIERHKEEVRDARWLAWVPGLSLDFKLGCRMLRKYPGLTVVAGLAMAFAIGIGASTFEVVRMALHPTLPLPEGERIVGLTLWDRARNEQRIASPRDFLAWKSQVRSVEDVGAFRVTERNLDVGRDVGEPIGVAEISATAFRVARVTPLLGRALFESDEGATAAPVVVLGYELWQRRFGGDPAIVGRVVRLGSVQSTVVGVMPDGFAFPIANELWVPLRLDPALPSAAGGAAVRVFGRLAPGVTLNTAQAELAMIHARAATDVPAHDDHLVAQVLRYPESILWISPDRLLRAGIYSVNGFAALLLLLVCGNVALLMFARAAARERELLVRNALGASRSRIVWQLFAEALVLGSLAAVVGLVAANAGLRIVSQALSEGSSDGPWPFWFDVGVSAPTVVYAAVLTLLAAGMAGVMPALKMTGRATGLRMRQASAGSGGLRMGGMWTGLIVTQIAATVLFTAVAYVVQRQSAAISAVAPAFPADRFLAVKLDTWADGQTGLTTLDSAAAATRHAEQVRQLAARLAAHDGVVAVTMAERLPLMPQSSVNVELERTAAADTTARIAHPVQSAAVALDFFETFEAPIVAGRGLTVGDTETGASVTVVNQLFVDRVLQGQNPIGRRFRYRTPGADMPGPWLEIVGVVRDLVPDVASPLNLDSPSRPQVYLPLRGAEAAGTGLYMAIRTRGRADALGPTVRQIAGDVSPDLHLRTVQPLDGATSGDVRAWRLIAAIVLVGSALALTLSLAGIYSVMSFTVSRRVREIGVRIALGADAPRVVLEVFRRPLTHIAIGVALGCGLVALLVLVSRGTVPPRTILMLVSFAGLMLGVCALACAVPTLRALRVEPTEALRTDA